MSNKRKLNRTGAVLATGALLGATLMMGSFAGPASAEDAVGGEITAGALDASFADFAFANTPYSFSPQAVTDGSTLTVSDETGSAAGWHVTVQASNLTANGGADVINDENLSFTVLGTPADVAGQPRNVTDGPNAVAASVTDPLDAPVEIVDANAGFGEGEYTQAATLEVAIPAMQDSGVYAGTLTVTATAGP